MEHFRESYEPGDEFWHFQACDETHPMRDQIAWKLVYKADRPGYAFGGIALVRSGVVIDYILQWET